MVITLNDIIDILAVDSGFARVLLNTSYRPGFVHGFTFFDCNGTFYNNESFFPNWTSNFRVYILLSSRLRPWNLDIIVWATHFFYFSTEVFKISK